MLKFATTGKDGLPLVTLGITDGNLERLRAGLPIHVAPAEMAALGLQPIHVVVMHGADERALVDELRKAGVDLPAGVDEAIAATEQRR